MSIEGLAAARDTALGALDLAGNIQDHPEGTPDEILEEHTAPSFTIDSEEAAEWYLGKLGAIEDERERVKAQFERINARLDADRRGLERQFEGAFENWLRARLSADPRKRKSLHLLHGTASIRMVPPSLSIVDRAAAVEWAAAHQPNLVTVELVQTLDARRYLALVRQDGEELPGIQITPGRESLKIDLGGTTK